MPDRRNGLSSKEATKFLEKFGPNTLPEKPPPRSLSLLFAQFKNPLVYVLLAAAFVTFLLGHHTDTAVILIAVLLNTTLGFIQERRASNALAALKKLIHPEATVIRDGKQKKIDVIEIVPGDVCVLNTGDKISADGVLVETSRLHVNEAVLTGESVPLEKNIKDKGFMGTIVVSGRGILVVEKTGKETEVGKIAEEIQGVDTETPLRKQIRSFSKKLSILVLLLIALVFVVGILSGSDIPEIFTTSVALAVSAIPEGLLVGLTVVLAIGMQRILKKKGLVRNLLSAETLGGVTTICTDKTGTLTEGVMTLTKTIGNKSKLALQALIANDLDDPMLIAARDWAKNTIEAEQLTGYKKLDSLPFSSKDRFFATLESFGKEKTIYVNGAPDVLINLSKLTKKERTNLQRKIKELTSSGSRVFAMARKKTKTTKKTISTKDINDLEFIGVLAFSDPVRDGVKRALARTSSAGVKTVVITGDYAQTAFSVLDKLGIQIRNDEVMHGKELEHMSPESLRNKLRGENSIKLFARTTPDQKLSIVEALKANGEVIAMMGDGVNDAPALNKADIGIVVGGATDVAKESADLVLLDSSFSTIVSAIEEGRGIFENIRKIILYLMSDAFEEIVAVVGALILSITIIPGLPIPVAAAQILWINLVSDGFPDLALTVDPKRKGLMGEPPRSPSEPLVSGWMKGLISIVSVLGGLTALFLFVFYYQSTNDLVLARSIAFATLGINSLFYVFSIRVLTEPFWKTSVFANKWLNLAVLAGLALQVLPFMFPVTRNLLGISQLNLVQWTSVIFASLFMFIMIEALKVVFRLQKQQIT
ncbi:cation-translocating P-type ATPase [Patescibacteria group bacterium]